MEEKKEINEEEKIVIKLFFQSKVRQSSGMCLLASEEQGRKFVVPTTAIN